MIELYARWAGLPEGAADVLRGWEVVPLHCDGELAAIAVLDGTEIHFAAAPEHRHKVIQRTRAREFLAPLLARRGYLTTRAMLSDASARRFLMRMGFEHTWADGRFDYYMLSELPFGKET